MSIIGTQDINVLISTINQRLNVEMPKMDLVYKKIAMTDSTNINKYAHYPIHITNFNFTEKLAFENQEYSKPSVNNIVVEGKTFRTPLEMISLAKVDDPYGIVERQSGDFVRLLTRVYDRELAKLINANGLAFDSRPFFGSHSSNASVPGRPDYSNLIVNCPPNKSGVLQAIQKLQSIVGTDGNLLHPTLDVTKLTFLVPTIAAKISLAEVINAGLTAEAVAAGAGGSTETRLAGYGNILVMPELNDTSVAGSDRRWYVIVGDFKDSRPAFIVRDFQLPQLRIVAPNEYLDHEKMAMAFYGEAGGGAGFGIPGYAIRCDF